MSDEPDPAGLDHRGPGSGEIRRVRVEDGQDGRLDRYLADAFGLSRTRVQGLLRDGNVRIAGRVPGKSERVEAGQVIEVRIPPPEVTEILAEDLPVDIVYEDEHLLVVDKPAGLVVHPAPGHRSGTLVNALLHHVRDLSGVGGRLRPGIVHRLDRDTSGLLVVAKTDRAHLTLSEELRRREIRRTYTAVSWGHLPDRKLRIEAPIARDPRNRKRMAVVEGGRRAVTHVEVLEIWVAAELLRVELETGRTHQIRVHLLHVGHPVAGDSVYGAGWDRGMDGKGRRWAREFLALLPRQFLHASGLSFSHPVDGRQLTFESAVPPDLAGALAWAQTLAIG